ncbi:hypothetical protein M0805_003128 [Coniferiporia weirii]|nr:hypothetical protein M0805_003128 [Coniferiporia weirii]
MFSSKSRRTQVLSQEGPHYVLGKKIGSGAFGVKLDRAGYYPITDAPELVIKIVKSKKDYNGKRYSREKKILDLLEDSDRHTNIIQFFKYIEEETFDCFIFEYAQGGSLMDKLKPSKNAFSEKEAASIMRDVMAGIAHLHQLNIVHFDIKPENMLYLTGRADSPVVISDFGLSVYMPYQDTIKFTGAGTLGFIPPEAYIESKVGRKSDIFAAGVSLYIFLTRRYPFNTDPGKYPAQVKAHKPDLESGAFKHISDEGRRFLKSLLNKDPSRRPRARTALEHKWLITNAPPTSLATATERETGKPTTVWEVGDLDVRFETADINKYFDKSTGKPDVARPRRRSFSPKRPDKDSILVQQTRRPPHSERRGRRSLVPQSKAPPQAEGREGRQRPEYENLLNIQQNFPVSVRTAHVPEQQTEDYEYEPQPLPHEKVKATCDPRSAASNARLATLSAGHVTLRSKRTAADARTVSVSGAALMKTAPLVPIFIRTDPGWSGSLRYVDYAVHQRELRHAYASAPLAISGL